LKQVDGHGLVHFEAISKSFGGVQALRNVSFSVEPGEIHSLIGENGAGKSTLIKICVGVHRPDSGKLLMDSHPVAFRSPRESEAAGIRTVHQEVPICRSLTVAENIYLGPNPPRRGVFLARRAMEKRSAEALRLLGVDLNPTRPVGLCSPAEQQLVMIARSMIHNVKLIILDEATSSLAATEVRMLFDVLLRLRGSGTAILFVSHRLQEVIEISDRVTVLRNGAYVGTYENRPVKLTVDQLAERIVGHQVEHVSRSRSRAARNEPRTAMMVQGLGHRPSGIKDVGFTLLAGEIVGIAGLRGAGRTELLECLFGRRSADSGTISVMGQPTVLRSPTDGVRSSIGFLTEARSQALFYHHSVRVNILSVIVYHLRRFLLIDRARSTRVALDAVRDLGIDTPSIHTEVQSLSGGNQQKVLLGRWLVARPSILLLDEPTRGVDVGAKAEIRKRIIRLAESGVAILYVSQDFEELADIADRVLVLSDGRLVDELQEDELTLTNIVKRVNAHSWALGGQASDAS